jgi:membrane protease YdiL (CAAX protease family)
MNKVSYRRGIIEAAVIYTIGRLGALIAPASFPDWTFGIIPPLFLALQLLVPPFWATRRIKSTKRERLSKRFWWLGPLLAVICSGIDLLLSLVAGLAVSQFNDVPRGPVMTRLFESGPNHLTLSDFVGLELRSATLILVLFTVIVICTRLAGGGMLRFTMPSGGNRVTL